MPLYEVVVGWTAPIDIALLSKGRVPDGTMAGMSAEFVLQDTNGNILATSGDVSIPDVDEWIVRYTPDALDLIEGTYRGRVKITASNGGVAYFPSGEADTWVVRQEGYPKSITGNPPIAVAAIPYSYLDADVTLAANSDLKVATQKATKAYVDNLPAAVAPIPLTYLDTDVTLAANSDVKVASQKAAKAYSDTKVAATRTINGHALSADVTVSKSDVSLGSVDNVQQLPLSYLDTDVSLAANSDAKVASQKAVKALVTAKASTRQIVFTIDGAGSVITTGVKGDFSIPFACTIINARLLADQSGSIVLDIWKDTYANYPPTIADTITASAKPTLASALKADDATLTGWTTAVNAGDTFRVNVNSCTTITRVALILTVTI